MDPNGIAQKAAEFGVTAFLLVIVLMGSGYALWKVGNKIVDATADSLRRQADTAEKTAQAVLKISDLAALLQVQQDRASDTLTAHQVTLQSIASQVSRNCKALHAIASAATDAIPHDHLPIDQQQRVRGYLEQAKRYLDRDDD